MSSRKGLIGFLFLVTCNGPLVFGQSITPKDSATVQGVATPKADNSDINTRDKNGATPTAQTQTNSVSDRNILAAVRRDIVKDKTLSTNAHNIKIMVAKGIVTLRGPVNNEEEKTKLEAITKQVPGVTSIENHLDIKQTKY